MATIYQNCFKFKWEELAVFAMKRQVLIIYATKLPEPIISIKYERPAKYLEEIELQNYNDIRKESHIQKYLFH